VRKTWAPRGHTPLVRHSYRHDRISAISAVSISPGRRRVGLYFRLQGRNLRDAQVRDFVRVLLRHLRGPLIVLWDNASIHRGPKLRELCQRVRRLEIEALPAYAPELNADEGVWAHAKARLANGRPEALSELERALWYALWELKRSPTKLRGCILQTPLSLF
jgi:transposase